LLLQLAPWLTYKLAALKLLWWQNKPSASGKISGTVGDVIFGFLKNELSVKG